MPPIIGIDLGPTNSLMAYVDYRTGLPRVIPDRRGQVLVPSVVSFGPEGLLVGDDAKGRLADPREVSAIVLKALKDRADVHFGEPVRKAVITVPTYFDERRREATRDAGRIAGLEVVGLLDEPATAALAYRLERLQNGVIAIYDLGGGTFDVSLLRVKDGIFEVLATNGHTRLGGDDFARALERFLLEDARRQHGLDLAEDREAMPRLRVAAEAAKRELSSRDRTTVRISVEDFAYQQQIMRAEFEDLIDPLVDGTLIRCRMALLDAGLAPADVDEVVLVGGSTRVPLVRRRVESLFGRPARGGIDPDEVVAMGAAVQASILDDERADRPFSSRLHEPLILSR